MIVHKDNLDVLFSPTTRCNLRCRYCYVNQGAAGSISDMTMEDVSAAYLWLKEYALLVQPKQLHITWFGGEPLLLGPDYLLEALDAQTSTLTGVSVVNYVQTNLTVNIERFVPIFKKYFNNSVGVSIDFASGCRIFPNGHDSKPVVENNIRVLKENNIKIGVVCTLTKEDLGRGAEIYTYFKRLGVLFRVNRAAASPYLTEQNKALSVSEYEEIVKEIADCYLKDPEPTITFYNIDFMIASYLQGIAVMCVDSERPYNYIGMEANGRIMPRCRFQAVIGNYHTDSAARIYDKFQSTSCKYNRPGACAECNFYGKVCIGSCIGEKDCDCMRSDCGYRTEQTCGLWKYVEDFLNSQGLSYSSIQ